MKIKHYSHSPLIWISATLLSGLLYFFAFHFFPKTFPLIHLDITMDLQQALHRADTIAHDNNFGPVEHHNAAMFHTDTTVKTFVELEAGGKDAFVAMMEEKLYMPYTWRVRHFKEFEKNETTIAFMPDGTPYGFIETISENVPGAQLSEHDARTIAETDTTKNWNIDYPAYSLVESSQKTQPSTRIDHTFVYERTDKKIGEGLYRLKVVVSGDKVTEVTHFVKVPEAFTRRYAEMRSANNTIAFGATLIMMLLYIICGCLFGLYWIIRKRFGLFKQPFKWGLFLATASVLVSINQLPFLWMHYNSAHSSNGFFTQLLLNLVIQLVCSTGILTIIIATAESLTRKAFGSHPQLWSLWLTENAASYTVLGRTLGGYLMVGFNLAFVIAFYLFSTRYLQWWTPSEMLFDPNILATYAPWFSPLAQSLNAGFMEECLFRAIPLAGAALLGTHFGKKNWWIGAAFILQAIVFGAAHANYPTQPSYARLIELFIPSFIFGAMYLRWGLMPTIITHCVYDIIWFSLPIFVSHAPNTLIYKTIIILVTLLPLLYVLYARTKQKSWSHLSPSHTNASWEPSILIPDQPEPIIATPESVALSLRKQHVMIAFGIIGLIAWVWTTPFVHDGITITVDRTMAVKESDAFLQQKNITLNDQWKTLPLIFNHYKTVPQIASQHKFIWQEGSKELYQTLLGTHLEPAHWTIRYAQFDTDIVQRSEEHKVMLYGNTVWRHHHQLPETTAGAQLTCEQARVIAHDAIKKEFNLDPAQLTEISAEQGQLPNRRNWLFIFADKAVCPLKTGQARINILIAGDEVIDASRTIHVPEEWERSEQNKQHMLGIVSIIFAFIFLFFLLFGAFIAFRRKKEYYFSKRLFITLFGIISLLSIAEAINVWPTLMGAFNTTAPFINQVFQFISIIVVSYSIKGALLALTMTYAIMHNKTDQRASNWLTINVGICIGLLFAGIMSIAHALIPTNLPLWPHYDSLAGSLSWLTSLLSAITNYLHVTVAISLLFLIVDLATHHWQQNRLLFAVVAMLCGISTIALPTVDMLPIWIIVGTTIGLILLALYRFIVRYNYSLIPLATGSFTIMQIIQQGLFNAYPGASLEAVISICGISTAAGLWYWFMNKK
jgi:hypothetical protein